MPRCSRSSQQREGCSSSPRRSSSSRRPSVRSGPSSGAAQIGRVHSARGLYGNAGSPWAAWYHRGGVGPLAETGIYNLKSLTALLGPVAEVLAAEAIAVPHREAGGTADHSARSRRLPRRPAPRLRGALVRRLEPGDPALPPAGARAVRRRGHGEPAGRRLGPARLRGLAQRRRELGGARARSTGPGSGQTACASASRRCARRGHRSRSSSRTSTCSTSSRRRAPPSASARP